MILQWIDPIVLEELARRYKWQNNHVNKNLAIKASMYNKSPSLGNIM